MEKKLRVYKSSAGSGKTFTLVKEFLKMCFKEESPFAFSNILAITFTNKATFEMKERILKALKELSREENQILSQKIKEETTLTEKEIQLRSAQILTSILHNYADFSISTIDKFSHKIIRTFAKDLNIALNFQVDMDEKKILKEVIGLLLDEIGQDKVISDFLVRYSLSRLAEEKSWKIEKELLNFSNNIILEKSIPYLEPLRKLQFSDYKAFEKQLNSSIKAFQNELSQLAQKGTDLIEENHIDPSSFAGNSKISSYFKKVSVFNQSSLLPSDQLLKNIENNKWTSGKCTAEDKSAINSIQTELEDLFYKIQAVIEKGLPSYYSQLEVLKNLQSQALVNEIEKRFEKLKKEEGILNISDFNKIIAEIVLDEPMPFIYERLGERFKHIMIDEFQDTSVLQFLNLLPLIEESLAKGNENLLVGDAKQAIYRFRGGEVDQFSEMPNYVPEIASENPLALQKLITLKSQFKEDYLNDNYRSSEAIVTFNNAFFQFIKESELSEKVNSIYHEHKQNLTKNIDSGYVGITFNEDYGSDLETRYGDLVIENIKQSIADGFTHRDIAILCRWNKDASAIANRLKKEGIPIVSSEALLLKNVASVQLIISLLEWFTDSESDLLQKNIVEHFVQLGILDEPLDSCFKLYIGKKDKFFSTLLSPRMNLDYSEFLSNSLLEQVEELIRSFEFDKTYDVYIQTLQDLVLDFSKTQGSDMESFIAWWKENESKHSITVSDGIDAVNIMTIHKSKGLEFPVVIYPFANQEIKHSGGLRKDFIWAGLDQSLSAKIPYALVEFNTNLSESTLSTTYDQELVKKEVDLINDSYVAFTRASERLYIHSKKVKNSTGNNLTKLPNLLDAFVNSNDLFTEFDGLYQLGELKKRNVRKESKEKLSRELEPEFSLEYISEDWTKRLSISSEYQSQEDKSAQEKSRLYGDLLHDILAQINDLDDLEEVLLKYHLKGIINSEEKELFKSKLTKMLSQENIKEFFSSKYETKKEASLLNSSGKIIRPDRVVYYDDCVAVLDFKTGSKNESHQQQVYEYCQSIANTTEKAVKGYLLYTELDELVQLS